MKKQHSQKQNTVVVKVGQEFNPKPLQTTFAPLENWLLCRPEVSFGAKATYSGIVQCANADGVASPSQEVLAKELGIKPRQLRTYIQELVHFRLIKIQLEGMPASNKYYFLYHPWMAENSLEKQPNIKNPVASAKSLIKSEENDVLMEAFLENIEKEKLAQQALQEKRSQEEKITTKEEKQKLTADIWL